MTTLLTVQTYPSIRAALGVLVDSNLLPDSIIQLDLYAGRAQSWLEAKDPLWATRTGADRQHLVNAVVLRCAGLLASVMPALTAEAFAGEYNYSQTPVDWTARAAALMADAEDEVQAVIASEDDAVTATMPVMFSSAKPYTPGGLVGGRGR